MSRDDAYTYPDDHSRILERLPETLWPTARQILADPDGTDIAVLIDAAVLPPADKRALRTAFEAVR